jgi:hypothetical protein
MKITNISKGPRGVNTTSGPVLIEPNEEVDVELNAAEARIAKATGWFDMSGKAQAETSAEPSTGPRAEHRGGGRYFVMDGENAIGEAMSKADAEAFNAMSDEDKAALLKKD